METRAIRDTQAGILLSVICLAIVTWLASTAVGATASLTADEIIDRMRANTAKIEDMSATITIEIYRDGAVSLTQSMELILQQPDKMRQQYLSPDYLAGNAAVIVGDTMWIYTAVTDQWTKKDLSTMSPAQQPWMMFRNILSGVRSELDDYTFVRVDADSEGDTYHISGTPADADAAYGRIDMWIDRNAFVPVRRTLRDTDGNFLVDARFLDATSIDNIVTMPLKIETYNSDEVLQNAITYSKISLNAGVADTVFAVPEDNDG